MTDINMESLSLESRQKQPITNHFLDLPRELRDAIYRHVFAPRRRLNLHGIRKYHQYFPPRLNLLLTCTKVHDEASQILWEVNTLRLLAHEASIYLKDDRPITKFFDQVKPSWTHLVRKVEVVFIFSPGECESARSYLPMLAEWARNGTLKEMILTGYGATNFRRMLDSRKRMEENPMGNGTRPGYHLRLFRLMQEAGVSGYTGLFADCKLQRRLNVLFDGLHKVKNWGDGWRYSVNKDDYHDAMDEMHEYMSADLYSAGILRFKNGKRVRPVVRDYDPQVLKLTERPSQFRSWYCVPKRKRDVLKAIVKRCHEDVSKWDEKNPEDEWDGPDRLWRNELWAELKDTMPFLTTPCPL